jgi:ubiquinone/menaquinone biosynthesis C-methylase UbiE
MINYERLYEYRFQNIAQSSRQAVWNVIASDIYLRMGRPEIILDPAAGRCEFLEAVPSREKWGVDRVLQAQPNDDRLRLLEGDILDVDIPANHFDGVFVSNLLEHLPTPDSIAAILKRLKESMVAGGRIAIMGPNFRYCSRDYFDCADHILPLTDKSVAEHLYAAGFLIRYIRPRYLPFSFRGLPPPSPALTRVYLRIPLAQRMLGKQFLLIADRPSTVG